MGSDGDSAINMGAHEIGVLDIFSHLLCVKLADGLLVKGMGLGMAIKTADSCKPGFINELVYICRVQGIGNFIVFNSKLIGAEHSKHGSMV